MNEAVSGEIDGQGDGEREVSAYPSQPFEWHLIPLSLLSLRCYDRKIKLQVTLSKLGSKGIRSFALSFLAF